MGTQGAVRGRAWLVIITMLAILGVGGAWAQEAAPSAPEAEVKEAPPPKKPEVALPMPPDFVPGIITTTAYTTLELGPTTGILAPYGYAGGMDTLARGWRLHRLGPVGVSPFLEYTGTVRTNVFQTSSNKQSDFVNGFNPGLRFEMPLAGRHKISVAYLGNYFIYSRLTNNSHYDHNVNVDAVFNFRGGLGLQFGNGYRNATEEATAVTGRKRKYDRDTPYGVASYKLGERSRLQAAYQFDSMIFSKSIDRQSNYNNHTGGATLFYKFWPKTSALLQYVISARQYPYSSQSDNNTQAILGGLTWDPTAKLSGTVKGGFTIKNFDTDIAGRDNSINSWALSMQNLYRYSRYTNISLVGQHSLQDDSDFGNNAYNNLGFFITWSHDLTFFQAKTYLNVGYINNHYINSAADPITGVLKIRDDSIINLGAGISRPTFRWLQVRLDYLYTNKGSNFSGYSFNEHRVLFGLQTSL